MTHTLGVRAASFATSAGLLALLVIGAFSVTITLQANTGTPPLPIPVFELPVEQPPPVTPRRETPPPERPLEETTEISIEPPLPPSDPTGPVTTTWQPPVGPVQITNPRWQRRPSDLERFYPARALARDIAGQVVLDCLVAVNGALNCSVVSETPANWGFGAAALRIAGEHRMVPATHDGQAVEGRYRMRVPFEVR